MVLSHWICGCKISIVVTFAFGIKCCIYFTSEKEKNILRYKAMKWLNCSDFT